MNVCLRRVRKEKKVPGVAGAAVIALLYLAFGLVTLDNFGITWDEPVHFNTADNYLDTLRAAGLSSRFEKTDFSHSMENYGPLFDLWGAVNYSLLTKTLGLLAEDNARHLHLVILSALIVFFTFLFAYRSSSLQIAIFSALFLFSFPSFIGHSFNNPKDIPITFIFVLGIFLFYTRLLTGKKKYSFWLAIAGGIGFATRIQYIILPVIILLYVIIYVIMTNIDIKKIFSKLLSFWDVLLALIISVPGGLLLWPYLWSKPLAKLSSLFEFYYLHPTQVKLNVLYWGNYYQPGLDLPWHYAPVTLAVTTPLITLAFFIVGLAAIAAAGAAKGPAKKGRSRKRILGPLLLLWIALGITPFMIPGQRVYGGIRHFLFIVPAFCIISGIGLDWLVGVLKKIMSGAVVYSILAILFGVLLVSVYSYHPFYNVYYNELVGGPKGAYQKFPLERWGNAYKSACRWLNSNAPPGAKVLTLIAPQIPRYYLRTDIRVIGPEYSELPPTDYDYSLYIIRNNDLLQVKAMKPVYSLSVKSQPICKIHKWGEDSVVKTMDDRR